MDNIEESIHSKRIRLVLRKQMPSNFVSISMAIVCFANFFQSGFFLAQLWLVLHFVTVAIRIFYLRSVLGLLDEYKYHHLKAAELRYSLLVFSTCILWGLTPVTFFAITSAEYIPLLFAMFFGILIGGTSRADDSLLIGNAYVIGFSVPFISLGVVYPTKPNLYLILCSIIFIGFLYTSLKKQFMQYIERAELAEQNQAMNKALAEKLEMEKDLQREKSVNFQNAKLASIGELAAGVAHEINNPLSIATGFIFSLKGNTNLKQDEKIQRKLSKIEDAHKRIINIVKGLKNFSRKDGDEFVAFSLSEVIEESILLVKEIYLKEEIRIDIITEEGLEMLGNRGEIQQVIMNILSNAKDALVQQAMPGKITIDLHSDLQWIYLTIEDNGIGMPAETMKNIFDPFFTTKEVNKGTGIGLSISHKIIQGHEGSIEVESVEKEFTRFNLIFPNKLKEKQAS